MPIEARPRALQPARSVPVEAGLLGEVDGERRRLAAVLELPQLPQVWHLPGGARDRETEESDRETEAGGEGEGEREGEGVGEGEGEEEGGRGYLSSPASTGTATAPPHRRRSRCAASGGVEKPRLGAGAWRRPGPERVRARV